MKKNGGVTFFMVYKCKLLKYNPEGEEEYTEVYFHSKNRRLLSIEEFEENYEEAIDTINGKLGDYMGESSGWMMDSIKAVNLNIIRYNPTRPTGVGIYEDPLIGLYLAMFKLTALILSIIHPDDSPM